MENSKQNKEKYFAAHWGQQTGRIKGSFTKLNVNKSCILNIEYLELKPLSSISGEHAEHIALLFGVTDDLEFAGRMICIGMFDNSESQSETVLYNQNSKAVDYLRRNGFAVDYDDTPVETLISYGWLQLKND